MRSPKKRRWPSNSAGTKNSWSSRLSKTSPRRQSNLRPKSARTYAIWSWPKWYSPTGWTKTPLTSHKFSMLCVLPEAINRFLSSWMRKRKASTTTTSSCRRSRTSALHPSMNGSSTNLIDQWSKPMIHSFTITLCGNLASPIIEWEMLPFQLTSIWWPIHSKTKSKRYTIRKTSSSCQATQVRTTSKRSRSCRLTSRIRTVMSKSCWSHSRKRLKIRWRCIQPTASSRSSQQSRSTMRSTSNLKSVPWSWRTKVRLL